MQNKIKSAVFKRTDQAIVNAIPGTSVSDRSSLTASRFCPHIMHSNSYVPLPASGKFHPAGVQGLSYCRGSPPSYGSVRPPSSTPLRSARIHSYRFSSRWQRHPSPPERSLSFKSRRGHVNPTDLAEHPIVHTAESVMVKTCRQRLSVSL